MLVGNKADLVDRKAISENQGRELAAERGCGFMETSALTGAHVKEAFDTIVERAVRYRREHAPEEAARDAAVDVAGERAKQRCGR